MQSSVGVVALRDDEPRAQLRTVTDAAASLPHVRRPTTWSKITACSYSPVCTSLRVV